MKCPNCGTELVSDFLYCKVCGEEINIVPNFEPELENSISEILINVAENMTEVAQADQKIQQDRETQKDDKRKKDHKSYKILGIIGGVFLLCIIVFAGIGGLMSYQYNSFDHQLSKADAFMYNKKYQEASTFYQRALEIEPNNISIKYSLAEAYMELDLTEAAIKLYQEVVSSKDGNIDEKLNACKTVIDLYTATENYQAINDFLMKSVDKEVIEKYTKYMAQNPEFSYVEGTYEEVIPLKLTANTSGNIYYTMDGSYPDENSEIYTAPIFLEQGEYLITAYFVNDYGVESDMVTKTFTIDVSVPFAPEISAYSGEYTVPTLIYAEVPEHCKIYYTTDGTDPTNDSQEYRNPIPMPIGKSRFKFITYNEEGIPSEVTARNFDLKLKTEISVYSSEQFITQGILESGKIYDLSGLSYEVAGRYLYKFQYVTNSKEIGDYYMIAEIYEDQDGKQTKTGGLYAVGIYDGTRYRLSLDEEENYVYNEF